MAQVILFDGGGSGSSSSSSSITNIGGNKDNGYIKLGLRGTLRTYTFVSPMSDSNSPSLGGQKFGGSELSLYITRGSVINASNNTNSVYIKKIRLYYENVCVRTIKCHRGDIFWSSNDNIVLRNTNESYWQKEYTIPLGSHKTHFTRTGGNPYAETDVESTNDYWSLTPGYHYLYVEIDYKVDGTTYSGDHTDKFQLGRVYVYDLITKSISLTTSSVTKGFYKGGTFNYTNLKVYANQYFVEACGGNYCNSYEVTSGNYSVASPDMNSAGEKTVTVSYGGLSATYTVTIYGVKSYTKPTLNSYYKKGQTNGISVSNTTITYDNDYEKAESVTHDLDTSYTGKRTVHYSATSSITGDVVTWTSEVTVEDYTLVTDLTNVTRAFNYNTAFSYAGLVVKRDYPNCDDETLTTDDYEVTHSEWVAGDDAVTVTVTDNEDDTKSATYTIDVYGMIGFKVEGKGRVARGGSVDLTDFTCYAKTFDNNGEGEWTDVTSSATPSYASDITSTVETDKEITFSYTDTYGVSKSAIGYLDVFEYTNLVITNAPTKFAYKANGDPATFDITGMVVEGIPSDLPETKEPLSNVALADGAGEYEAKLVNVETLEEYDVGDELPVGHYDLVIGALGVEVRLDSSIEVFDFRPVNGATFTVDFTDLALKYLVGDTINKNQIKVTASEMTDGSTNYDAINFVTIKLNNTAENLTFGNSDAIGNYTLSVYYGETLLDSTTVLLKGISSISNVFYNGTLKVGEKFDISKIRYTVNYNDGDTATGNPNDITKLELTTDGVNFTQFYDEDIVLSANFSTFDDYEVKVIAHGKNATIHINVKRLYSIAATIHSSGKTYKYGDPLQVNKVAIVKTYKDSGSVESTENIAGNDMNADWLSITNGTINALQPDSRSTSVTAIGVSITEGDITKTASFNIDVIAIRSVYIYKNGSQVTSITKDYGDIFSLNGYNLYVILNDDTLANPHRLNYSIHDNGVYDENDELLGVAEYNYKNTEIKETENVLTTSCAATYGAESVSSSSINIYCHYLSDFEVTFTGVESAYYTGDTIDLSDIVLEKTISSTNPDETSYDYLDENEEVVHVEREYPKTTTVPLDNESVRKTFGGTNVNGTSIPLNTAGTFDLEVFYNEFGISLSDTKSIAVTKTAIQKIEWSTTSAFKALNTYAEDMRINFNGVKVTITYNNGATEPVDYTDNHVKFLIDGEVISKNEMLEDTSLNGKDIYVRYYENDTTYYDAYNGKLGALTVAAKQCTSIEVYAGSPHKTTFAIGDKFKVDGLLILAHFNNDTTEWVSLNDAGLSISGTNASEETLAVGHTFDSNDTIGSWTITLSYSYNSGTARTTTYTIALTAPQLAYLKTNANDPNGSFATQYKDTDVFSFSGLVVTAIFTNGYEEILTNADLDDDATSVLHLDGSSQIQLHDNNEPYGEKTITITGTNPYDEDDSMDVEVKINVTSSGAIKQGLFRPISDDYNKYIVGEAFNGRGLNFDIVDVDGNEFSVAPTFTSIVKGKVFRSAQRIDLTVVYAKGDFKAEETIKLTISVASTNDLVDENAYQLAIGLSNGTLFDKIEHEEATIELGKKYDDLGNLISERYPLFHEDYISPDNDSTHTDTYGYNVYNGSSASAKDNCIGYIDMGLNLEDGTVVRNAHIVLFDDPVNPIDGSGNIEVKFPHYVEGLADRINHCKFGIVYNNRLFVSGNPDFKNYDWHTQETNNIANEFTYFSDLDYCRYGGNDTAIVGYDIYRDGDLIVIKESSKHQATLYRRTFKLTEATAYNGEKVGEDLLEEAFPKFDINSNGGIGGLSHRSIVNFLGETLVLTKEGLKAITAKNDVFNNAKFTYDVSSYINPRIKEEELENAHLFTFKEILLLKTNRGVYVGYNNLRNEDNEYEWYFLDNIKADIFFNINEHLFYANDDGEIYRIDKKIVKYVDKTRIFIPEGATGLMDVSESANTIIVNKKYAPYIQKDNVFHLMVKHTVGGEDIRSLIFASLGLFVFDQYRINQTSGSGVFDQTAYNGVFYDNSLEIKPYKATGEVDYTKLHDIRDLYFDGREIYFDNIVGASPRIYTDRKYHLVKVDPEDTQSNLYKVYDEFDEEVSLLGVTTFRMSFVVNHLAVTRISTITDYGDNGAKQFKLIGDHDKELDIIKYNSVTGTYSGVITLEEKIAAYYITAPYNFGSLVSAKTIWEWVIANDTELASYMDVGYLFSRKQGNYDYVIKSASGARQLKFGEEFNFTKIQFTSDKLPHIYSKYRVLAGVGFIRFAFKNDEDSNIVLTTLQLVYSLNTLTKGVN